MIRRPLLARAAPLAPAVPDRASLAGAAQTPDAWLATRVTIARLVAEYVSASSVHVDATDGKVAPHRSGASASERAKVDKPPDADPVLRDSEIRAGVGDRTVAGREPAVRARNEHG